MLLFWSPLRGADMSFVTFAVSALPILWALPRLQRSDVRLASLRRVFEVMGDGVLVSDAEGRVTRGQPRRAGVAGSGLGDRGTARAAGRLPAVGTAACGCEALDDAEDAGGVVATLEVDGKPRHLSLLRSRLGLDGAPDSGCVIVLRDLTEQVEAMRAQRDSEQRLRIIFEQSPVGVCLLDADLIVREANEHFAALAGIRRPSSSAGRCRAATSRT